MTQGTGRGDALSLYCHIPFCRHICSYCDLNAYAGMEGLIPAYMGALSSEVRRVGRGARTPVHTIYVGGGTPSITPLPLLAGLFAALRDSFAVLEPCEVSFEANPETLDLPYLDGLRALGVNRLSIGAQSAQPNELALFQRTHTFDDVARAVAFARRAGFENLSLDLIYGVPGQTLDRWQETVDRALALEVDHFSIYALSYDFDTPMRAWIRRGLLAEPDDERAAAMYDWADGALAGAGYCQYEISSWARVGEGDWESGTGGPSGSPPSPPAPRLACRHNLQYWRNAPYLGLGAGAHGYEAGYRYANVLAPGAYVERMKSDAEAGYPFSPAVIQKIPIDRRTEMNETMLTGLRLVGEGVGEETFRARFGVGMAEVYANELEALRKRKLIEWGSAGARLTREGRLVANWVFERFV